MLVCFSLRAGFADFPFTANCSGVVIPSRRQLSNTAATYRQLFANKLQLQAMLAYYKTYGLLDKVK